MVIDPMNAVERAAEAVRLLLDRPGLRHAIRLAEQAASEPVRDASTPPRPAEATVAEPDEDTGRGSDTGRTR